LAEILGLGLSHFPGPMVPPELWTKQLVTNVQKGRIPAEVYEDRSSWPEPMRAEWGDDEGLSSARRHYDELLAGYRQLRAELDAFNPDFVLIWGDDQYENFHKDCIPAFCVYILDEVRCQPLAGNPRGPYRTELNPWGFPSDKELRALGAREPANQLARYLLEQGFDISYAYQARSERGLAHSFANTLVYLDYDWRGMDYPVLPFHVNCYGSEMMKTAAGDKVVELSPPAPSPKRCFEIGRATARFFAQSPWRAALIGSASWSHGTLTPKHHRLYPDYEADQARLRELRANRFDEWGRLDLKQIEDSGQHEMLNWICLAGAMTELGQEAEVLQYAESYLFNSSKCFARFRPRALTTA